MRLVVFLALAAGCTGASDIEDPVAVVPELGLADERAFTVVADDDDDLSRPRDLAFNPERPDELWVVNQSTDGVVLLFDPGSDDQEAEERIDAHGLHFMDEVSSIAFGAPGTFGSCGESMNTYNGQESPNTFMGPVLWPSDLDIYAEVNQHNMLLGSHLDMLHQSPLCMGIAHDDDNAYWVFDGHNGNLVYYDFQEDHGPGYDDHSDGIVRRYHEVELEYEAGVPGHLALDAASGLLYVADTGDGRILRVNTGTGEVGKALRQMNEPLEEYVEMDDVAWDEMIEGLDQPSGIALVGGRLFVTDHGTGEIIAYDLDGAELDRVETGADGIMGITAGPDGKLWYVDGEAEQVVRLDPEG